MVQPGHLVCILFEFLFCLISGCTVLQKHVYLYWRYLSIWWNFGQSQVIKDNLSGISKILYRMPFQNSLVYNPWIFFVLYTALYHTLIAYNHWYFDLLKSQFGYWKLACQGSFLVCRLLLLKQVCIKPTAELLVSSFFMNSLGFWPFDRHDINPCLREIGSSPCS